MPASAVGIVIDREIFCPECGYNLFGLTSDRCPECGHDIVAIRDSESDLPWLDRRRIGGFRAYWKTVWRVMFEPRRFVTEIAQPIRERDARRFRAGTLGYMLIAVAVFDVVMAIVEPEFFLDPAEAIGWWFVALTHACAALGLLAVTSAPYYAMRHPAVPIERSYRAAVLSFYACAPLAWSFLPVMLIGAGAIATQWDAYVADLVLYLLGAGSLACIAITAQIDLTRLVGRMLLTPMATAWIIFKTFVLGALGFLLAAVGIPLLALALAVVYYSLA